MFAMEQDLQEERQVSLIVLHVKEVEKLGQVRVSLLLKELAQNAPELVEQLQTLVKNALVQE